MSTRVFPTLDAALTDIADRSFEEPATVTPTDDGYEVDDYPETFCDEVVMWSYEGGMELPSSVSDHSRVHDPAESYNDAQHIRYNLDAAVMALAEGHAVTFAYVIVDGYPSTPEDIADEEAGFYDGTVGWALLARIHPVETPQADTSFHARDPRAEQD